VIHRLLTHLLLGLLVVAAALLGSWVRAGEGAYKRTFEAYVVPDVALVNQDGESVSVQRAFASDTPVLLDFFFTTCNTICPTLSTSFAHLQERLGEHSAVRLYSVAIDPAHDSPDVLRRYRERFGARPGWDLLTGAQGDVDRLRKAFAAHTPNKMAHRPLNFLWSPTERRWVRLEGLIAGSDLLREYRRLPKPAADRAVGH